MKTNAKKYPCLNKMWKCLCADLSIPKGTPMPNLPLRSEQEMEEAEICACIVTVGQLSDWLDGTKSPTRNPMLKLVLGELRNEADNV